MKSKEIKLKKIKISLETIMWFLIVFFNYEPAYFSEIRMLDMFYYLGKLATFVLIPIIILIQKNYKMNSFVAIVAIAEVWLFLSSILFNHNSVFVFFNHALQLVFFILIMDFMLSKNPKKCVGILLLIYEMLIYGCFITIVLFPNGLYGNTDATRKYWLLGQVNSNIVYILPGLMLSFVYSFLTRGKHKYLLSIRTIALLAVSVFVLIFSWSANSLVGFIVASFVLISNIYWKRIRLWLSFAVSVALWIMFGVFRIQSIFSNVIENVLHRDLTFSGRTDIWNVAIKYILQHPFVGWGIESIEDAINKFGVFQTHNKYFYLLYQGGIVLFILFFVLIILIISKVDFRKPTLPAAAIVACASSFLIMIVFESFNSQQFFIPFVFAFRIADINRFSQMNSLFLFKKSKRKIGN